MDTFREGHAAPIHKVFGREGTIRQKLLLRIGEKEILVDFAHLLQKLGRSHVSGIVRIPAEEYASIDPRGGRFAHFNLEETDFETDKRYVFPKILRPGRRDQFGNVLQPPLLSFEDIYLGTCIDLEHHLPYDALTSAHFAHSMSSIKTVEALKSAMLRRYRETRPYLREREIFEKGVSFSLFDLTDQFTPRFTKAP